MVIQVAPPPAGHAVYFEGDTVNLSGTLTDPGDDVQFATLSWAVTGPDGFSAGGPGSSFRFTIPDPPAAADEHPDSP